MRRSISILAVTLAVSISSHADEVPSVAGVEFQPLFAQAKRIADALEYLGEPLAQEDWSAIEKLAQAEDQTQAVLALQRILDKYVLVSVNINPESRVKAQPGSRKPVLVQQGWRNFLVKVHNEAGVTAPLQVSSPNALPMYLRDDGPRSRPQMIIGSGDVAQRFLDAQMYDQQPLNKNLSGLEVEYRIVQLFCRDAGKREAALSFDVGQGTQDIGFRNEVNILFESLGSTEVTLRVHDENGQPCMGSFVIRDRFGRVYPSQARRLAPDFFFHPQIYRADKETVYLPPGTYNVEFGRGPEYTIQKREIVIPERSTHEESFELSRWIEPKKLGWYSGDHHVHAAGCAHYDNPTQGVKPADMFRHALGEDLNVSCVLSWGPCWYFQKQYFDGKVHELSQENYLMRYDIEVSGFPSSHAGHLCLLNLTEDDFEYDHPVSFAWNYAGEKGEFSGTKTQFLGEWPSWDLPVLQWGKAQGGVVGFSHSGWGLDIGETRELPNYTIPPFNGIGANEYIVDVVHNACDFISTVDTPSVWELNIWYHTLNCGFQCRISGETDFPCIYGQRVGLGRVYVKCDGKLTWEEWVQGVKDGRSYVTDGLSHLIDFRVNDCAVGENGSELGLDKPSTLTVTAKVAAFLGEEPDETIRRAPLTHKPYWHVERARIGNTRNVPVEVVVNGHAVATKEILADGSLQDVSFEVPIEHSSWVALRIFPSSHTNPVFVKVGDKPIRASKRSAQWCLQSVEQCWKSKEPAIRPHEKSSARAAFDEARRAYEKILAECVAE